MRRLISGWLSNKAPLRRWRREAVSITTRARAASEGDQEEIAGSNSGRVQFGNEDCDAVFSPNFPRDTWFWGLVFRIALGVRRFYYSAQFETEGRLVERKESEISSRPRGLVKYLEQKRPLRVESPIGRAAGRDESVRSIS